MFLHRRLAQKRQKAVWKDQQDKDSIRVEWQENTKSATDERTAELEETAFSKGKTSPEEQLEAAEGESKSRGQSVSNPLEVSPANHEVSKAATRREEHMDQIEKGLPREELSRAGSGKKGAEAKRYEPDDAQRIPGTKDVG